MKYEKVRKSTKKYEKVRKSTMEYDKVRWSMETRLGIKKAMGKGIARRLIRFINWGSVAGEERAWEMWQKKCGVCTWGGGEKTIECEMCMWQM